MRRQASGIQKRDQANGIEDSKADRNHHQKRVDPIGCMVNTAQQRLARTAMAVKELRHGTGTFI
jgi:hypothetical protein